MTAPRMIRAAGCIVWRYGSREPEVLLVHRPRWSDWSFPKGKLDRGETTVAAAVREVDEETGLRVKLGIPLPTQRYTVRSKVPKEVHYWSAVPPANADLSTYEPNSEIDEVRWYRLSKAGKKLSYEHDAELLDTFAASAYDSSPLIILRHAQARSRKRWSKDDAERPLRSDGIAQAERLIPVLAAYGITRVITSDAARCVDTVLPFVNSARVKLTLEPTISEDAEAPRRVRKQMKRLMRSRKRIAVCSHRPVLPDIFNAIGLDPIALEPGAFVVVHRREGKVVDLETFT